MNTRRYFSILICFIIIFGCTKVINYSTTSSSSSGSGSSGGSSGGSGGGTSNPSNPSYTPPVNGGIDTGSSSTGVLDSLKLTATSLTPCASDSDVVEFKITAINIPAGVTYEWYFGDGNFTKSGRQTERNAYKKAGNYTITAKINLSGKTIAERTLGISTNAGNGSGLTPSFTTALLNPTVGNSYSFNNTSTIKSGRIVKFLWDLGDGRKDSNTTTVLHSYTQTNTNQSFSVKLTVTSDLGCTATATQNVSVLPK